jgi:hypothetical protein
MFNRLKKDKSNHKGITRRSFFQKIWVWLGVVAGLEFAGLLIAFMFSGQYNGTKKKINLYVHAIHQSLIEKEMCLVRRHLTLWIFLLLLLKKEL